MSNPVTPTSLPTLARGGHQPGSEQACVMEYVSVLAGENWSDRPDCTHPMLSAVARNVNDSIESTEERSRLLVPLIGRLFGSNDLTVTPGLLWWCVRKASGRCGNPLTEPIETLGRMLLQDAPYRPLKVSHDAPYITYVLYGQDISPSATGGLRAVLMAANYSVQNMKEAEAAREATYSQQLRDNALAQAEVAAQHAHALTLVTGGYTDDPYAVSFLREMLDEYDRLTGRTSDEQQVSTETLTKIARLVQV